jgi:hypothetical protein
VWGLGSAKLELRPSSLWILAIFWSRLDGGGGLEEKGGRREGNLWDNWYQDSSREGEEEVERRERICLAFISTVKEWLDSGFVLASGVFKNCLARSLA